LPGKRDRAAGCALSAVSARSGRRKFVAAAVPNLPRPRPGLPRPPRNPISGLFTPYRVGSLELRNRIVIAPMCQYSADEGRATDWHVIHLGHLELSGAALLSIEATAVLPEGRISSRDLGLWSDDTERALGHTLEIVRRYSDMPI